MKENKTYIVAVSGFSGAGKDYLTDRAREHYEDKGVKTYNLQMTTEREDRGENETKICISSEEYDKLENNGELIGNHTFLMRYGFNTNDLKTLLNGESEENAILFIELNPFRQTEFPKELKEKLGVKLDCWIGVTLPVQQAIESMKERGETNEMIAERVDNLKKFEDSMKENKSLKIIDNGPDNRDGSPTDFIKIVETAIGF